jgi:NarL family two-component system response regulator LiaR
MSTQDAIPAEPIRVVLMDLLMPGMDGVEATRRIKKASPRTQVIVLTSYHEDEHIFPAIRAGEAVINPRVAARVVKELHGERAEPVNAFTKLTDREMDVLRQIAAGKSNHEIAQALVLSEKTVKTHITNILSKLHLADLTQAAVFAWQAGIVRRDQP